MLVNHLGKIVKLGQIFATNCQYLKYCTYFCTQKT